MSVLSARASGGDHGRLRSDVQQHEGEVGQSAGGHWLHPPVQTHPPASAGEGGRRPAS